MKNFFNAIGVADMEKVHSAIIGWMLSDDCEAFGTGQKGKDVKSKLLCSLFGITPFCVFDEIKVNVEVYDIDILITTKLGPIKECWIIENKIKSNQHDNQLDKYVRIINGVEMTKSKAPEPITEDYKLIISENQHYCFLTLIEELPRGIYAQEWINLRYSVFHSLLQPFLSSMIQHLHSDIIREYASCISEMTDALNDFLQTPSYYPNVFSDGSKKKTQKNMAGYKGGKYALYIAECGLETIFQKCYMGIIAKGIKYPYEIKDTHGNAMLNIDVTNSINWSKVKSKYPNNQLNAGIEFQNGTLKIQIHDIDNKIGNKAAFNKNWVSAFIKASGSPKNIYPSKNNGRYYVSKTYKKFNTWWGIKQPWNIIIKECIAELQNAVNNH